MKNCLFCGAKSWGPVGRLDAPCADPAYEYVKCDNCGLPARVDLLSKEAEPITVASNESFTDNFLKGFQSVMPPSETRTERLLRAILTSGEWRMDQGVAVGPISLVAYVRRLEAELDMPSRQFLSLAWGHHDINFKDRSEFTSWFLRGIDYAKERTAEEGKPSDVNINRLCKHFADWLLDMGAPTETDTQDTGHTEI